MRFVLKTAGFRYYLEGFWDVLLFTLLCVQIGASILGLLGSNTVAAKVAFLFGKMQSIL